MAHTRGADVVTRRGLVAAVQDGHASRWSLSAL